MLVDDKRNQAIASDHNWLFAEMEVNFHVVDWPKQKEERWDVGTLKQTDFKKAFKEEMDVIGKCRKDRNPTVDERMTTLNNAINKAAEKSIKTKNVGGEGRKKKTAVPKEYIEACRNLKEKENEYTNSLDDRMCEEREEDKEKIKKKIVQIVKEIKDLRRIKMEINTAQREQKNKNLRKLVRQSGGQSSKLFWNLAQKVEKIDTINTLRKEDGTQTTTVKETLKRAEEHFRVLFKDSKERRRKENRGKDNEGNNLPKRLQKKLVAKFKTSDIKKAIKNLKNGKATGVLCVAI